MTDGEQQLKTVRVTVTTTLDAVYEYPDVPEGTMDALLKSPTLHGFPQISLVNVSSACLVMPVRIIKTIAVDGEVKWRCPA